MGTYQRLTAEHIECLTHIVGAGYVYATAEKRLPYDRDEGADDGFARLPDAVVLPGSATEIAAIMRWANRERIPVVPRGAGTGLEAGAVVNRHGGIVLSTERLNHMIEFDAERLYAVVEPAVRTAVLQAEAKKRGLLYAGDPCSGDSCFIGGNGATNAGGNRAVKYGTTRDQIYSIEVVTPQGDITTLGGRLKKVTTGYPLEKIVIGSEGTLGIITKLTVKLLPLPPYSAHILAVFPDAATALSVVTAFSGAGIEPTCLEFMDNDCVRIVEKFLGEKQPYSDVGNYMIMQVDSKQEILLDETCLEIDACCRELGAIDVFVADADRIWRARKNFSEASGSEGPVAMEDFVVPPDCLAALLTRLKQIAADTGLSFRGVSHAGDGNLHLDVLRKELDDALWRERLSAFETQACNVVYELGGKLSGEHGIGECRKTLMKAYTDPVELELMKALKKAWDPNLILNPGKIFDVE